MAGLTQSEAKTIADNALNEINQQYLLRLRDAIDQQITQKAQKKEYELVLNVSRFEGRVIRAIVTNYTRNGFSVTHEGFNLRINWS